MASRRSGCGSVLALYGVIIGFAIFSMLWDAAANAWGLDHTTVLGLFLGAAIVASTALAWMRESGWHEVTAWWNRKRRERQARER